MVMTTDALTIVVFILPVLLETAGWRTNMSRSLKVIIPSFCQEKPEETENHFLFLDASEKRGYMAKHHPEIYESGKSRDAASKIYLLHTQA